MSFRPFRLLSAVSKRDRWAVFIYCEWYRAWLPFLIDNGYCLGVLDVFLLPLDEITSLYPWTGQVAVFPLDSSCLLWVPQSVCLCPGYPAFFSAPNAHVYFFWSVVFLLFFFSCLAVSVAWEDFGVTFACLFLCWPLCLVVASFSSSLFAVDVLLESLVLANAGSQFIFCWLCRHWWGVSDSLAFQVGVVALPLFVIAGLFWGCWKVFWDLFLLSPLADLVVFCSWSSSFSYSWSLFRRQSQDSYLRG